MTEDPVVFGCALGALTRTKPFGKTDMKKIVFAAFAVAFAVPAAAAPGDTATTQGTANAEIVAPITITHDNGAALDFGTLTAGGGGTVVVTSAGVGSDTGDVTLLTGSTNAADSFTVSGDANRAFTIVTGTGSVASGSNTMSFTTSPSAASGTLSGTGSASFTVGGTLTVGANQAPGTYTGSYDATVTYS